jgi:ADP-ribosyl-[dinitrogen reductase] hydrolase
MADPADTGDDPDPERPIPETYWVAPGRLLVGEYPGSASRAAAMDRLRRFLRAGVTCFVDLTELAELPSYEPLLPMATADGRRIEYLREPIPDHGVPASREAMRQVLATIDAALEAGHVVYVHCRAGLGRSALVAGCWLASRGERKVEPLDELQRRWTKCAKSAAWPSVPETDEQAAYVRAWRSQQAGVRRSRRATPDIDDRVRGALLGLAIGDAAGAAREFDRPADGLWTQHTALTLCLAESLLECRGPEPRDQIERYLRWQRDGHLSATGRPSAVTPDVAKALASYQWRRQRMAGSHDPRDRSTASLPRVLAAVAFASSDVSKAVHLAGECSRTTHQSPVVVDACRFLGALLVGALRGAAPADLRKGLYEAAPGLWSARPLKPAVAAAFRAAGKSRPEATPAVSGQPDAVQAVVRARAALSASFEETVRRACDGAVEPALEAALAGALAGASLGAGSIPPEQMSSLARLDLLEEFASRLARTAGAAAVVRGQA